MFWVEYLSLFGFKPVTFCLNVCSLVSNYSFVSFFNLLDDTFWHQQPLHQQTKWLQIKWPLHHLLLLHWEKRIGLTLTDIFGPSQIVFFPSQIKNKKTIKNLLICDFDPCMPRNEMCQIINYTHLLLYCRLCISDALPVKQIHISHIWLIARKGNQITWRTIWEIKWWCQSKYIL